MGVRRAGLHCGERHGDEPRGSAMTQEAVRIIRPAAVLDPRAAAGVLVELDRLDVSVGGTWSASSALWQRYDRPWDGPGGSRGSAQLVGSIAVMYDAPNRHQITIYKVTVTEVGRAAGWTVESVCDDALASVGLSLATCPRAELSQPPVGDPFHRSRGTGTSGT
jgi:hypothetical protein